MQNLKAIFFLFIVTFIFTSCDSTLNVNAEWKDITIVYGLLDQNDSVQYLKITKAFLGEGDALSFAKIADSSNYKEKLEVTLEEWDKSSQYDSTLKNIYVFDTTTVYNKEAGDSIFYFPVQLVYKNKTPLKLNENYLYKLFIRNTKTNNLITSQTRLVYKIGTITKPYPIPASFVPGAKLEAIWTSAKGGKRYQLVARFHYLETKKADTSQKVAKYVDWVIFNDLKTENTNGGTTMKHSYSADVFYSVLGSHIPVDETVNRSARTMEYIFTVAADELNTYMEVSEPSYTIVQEKPPYTNIVNGIGIFSSRHNNTKDYPVIQPSFTQQTLDELKVNPNTYLLGF